MNESMKEFNKVILGDCKQEDDIVIASGEETKEYGFLHTWYIDAPSASFSGTQAGVRWEIIAVDKISEMIEEVDPEDYEDGEDDEDYKEMKKFIKELEDSVCDGELIFNPENELESYSRIW